MNQSIKLAGYVSDKAWPHFLWIVTIANETFHYKTGIGHFTPRIEKRSLNWNRRPENSVLVSELNGWAHVPKMDEVIRCLFDDAQCSELSFDEFCSNFGYDTDSIKALNTYQACSGIRAQLIRAYGPVYRTEFERVSNMDV